jgi:translation elongation factor EF-1alpha
MSVNVVVVGHVDHGKSTLIGRLLYDSETLPEDKVAEIQKLLEEFKRRFEFAYFLDSFEEELKEERTIDTTRVLFKGRNYYTIVDVPGHKEFIKNMLTGASHAQVAILVVSCVEGIQEQTRRHAFLINMLGIKDVIVAINKMDLVDYQEEYFNKLKEEVSELLASLGYSGNTYVPISAMQGDNIYNASSYTTWYQGPTLIEALDAIEPEEVIDKPLRFVTQGTYLVDSEKISVGRVESGTVRIGDELIFRPSGTKVSVKAIRSFPIELDEAQSGDSIGMAVSGEVDRGDVGGHPAEPPIATDKFQGEVVLLEGSLRQGDQFEIKCASKKVSCQVESITERISSETGTLIDDSPEEIGENEAAKVVFTTEPMVVEKFSEIPELGRFILVRNGKNIGAGIVL